MNDYLQIKGKRALVSGGTKGVGQAVVTALHEAGAIVMTTARSHSGNASDFDHFVVADVSTGEGADRVAKAVLDDKVLSHMFS